MNSTFFAVFAIGLSAAKIVKAPIVYDGDHRSHSLSSFKGPSISQGLQLEMFETDVEKLRQRLKIPGMAVAIVKDQKLLWAKGFGYSDLERKIPATTDTLFHLASVTKTFASMLVMQLFEQGQLDLDEPISRYAKTFKDDAVKIRHIITHTSQGTPGERFTYNGNLYGNLTPVLEKKTGKKFSELVVEKFFEPFGMTASVPYHNVVIDSDKWTASLGQDKLDRYKKNLAAFAQPYMYYGAGETIHVDYPLPWYNGVSAGVLSTVLDMAKYDIAIDQHVLLKKETQDKAWTPSLSNSGKRLPYGLGWFVMDHYGTKIVWHTGDWGSGFSAILFKIPEKNLSLIVLANSEAFVEHQYAIGQVMVDDVVRNAFVVRFLEMYGLDHGAGKGSEKAVKAFIDQRRKAGKTAIKVDPKLLETYVGKYQFDEKLANRVYTVTLEGDRLFLQISGEPTVEVLADSKTTFFLKTRPWWLRFRTSKGQPPQLEFVEGQNVIKSKRIE